MADSVGLTLFAFHLVLFVCCLLFGEGGFVFLCCVLKCPGFLPITAFDFSTVLRDSLTDATVAKKSLNDNNALVQIYDQL